MIEVHVFDTFAHGSSGRILHFDVVLAEKDPAKALACAREWLQSIGEPNATVKAESCSFCHSSSDAPEHIEREIASQGYAIIKMEGCPK